MDDMMPDVDLEQLERALRAAGGVAGAEADAGPAEPGERDYGALMSDMSRTIEQLIMSGGGGDALLQLAGLQALRAALSRIAAIRANAPVDEVLRLARMESEALDRFTDVYHEVRRSKHG